MKGLKNSFFFAWAFLVLGSALGAEIQTNEVIMVRTPTWLTRTRVNQVVDSIQRVMEWDIRQVQVVWHDAQSFQAVHRFGPTVVALTHKPENRIDLGPRVQSGNFDAIFGHELVHVILFQKYKNAVPDWLEEGLANYLSKHDPVNYFWLGKQSLPSDIRSLSHPFAGAQISARLHYQASTAVMEMIARKCPVRDLLQLSVGEKLEGYISTFCEIPDLNSEFKSYLKKKIGR